MKPSSLAILALSLTLGAQTTEPKNYALGAHALQPQPFDVPPIQEEYGNPGTNWCDMGSCTFIEEEPKPCPKDMTCVAPPHRRTRLTCADKTRFLMTSEDGKAHCIALVPAQTSGGK